MAVTLAQVTELVKIPSRDAEVIQLVFDQAVARVDESSSEDTPARDRAVIGMVQLYILSLIHI